MLCALGGCSEPCCTIDGYPISLLRAPADDPRAAGGLRVHARYGDAADDDVFAMAVDTGASFTYVRRDPGVTRLVQRTFEILDQRPSDAAPYPVRARFRNIDALPIDVPPPAAGETPVLGAVLGGALLRNFSVVFRLFGDPPVMTLWPRQGASDDFLTNSGYAVLQFDLFGGAELTAAGRPDLVGLTAPLQIPPTRIVMRVCGAPAEYLHDDTQPAQACCTRGDEVTTASGADLALMVATGIAPVVVSQSAWSRIVTRLAGAAAPEAPAAGPPLVLPTLAAPVEGALWSALPRLAFVDLEFDARSNPGPCVELARARRLEWVERHHAENACVQPCDTDPQDTGKALNGAAYLEVGGGIPVAVVPDSTPFLQGLRAEIRPEGPEIDGLLGAAALARTSMEIDYRSQPGRVILTCDPAAEAQVCWTSPRCQRLLERGEQRSCFHLPKQGLPPMCAPSGCG
jgi:hypothetical protein